MVNLVYVLASSLETFETFSNDSRGAEKFSAPRPWLKSWLASSIAAVSPDEQVKAKDHTHTRIAQRFVCAQTSHYPLSYLRLFIWQLLLLPVLKNDSLRFLLSSASKFWDIILTCTCPLAVFINFKLALSFICLNKQLSATEVIVSVQENGT